MSSARLQNGEGGSGGRQGAMSGEPTDSLHLEEQCRYCFDVLHAHFFRTELSPPRFPGGHFPLFVTWNKIDTRGNVVLRGCIGNLSGIDLHQGIVKYASASAFDDRRFSPIALQEVKGLECSVTLLHHFEKANHHLDWTIGRHGLIIEFEGGRGSLLSATFLPSVCQDQGWSQQECIDSLIRKAGYKGAIDSSLRSSLSVTRYQGCKATIDYPRYRRERGGEGVWNAA
eukprot:CAMPEP_0181326160 /NCGR_PEP_ID=MMETSP1101-20121128/21333_1 /TAXON_ID=46948 /ORGANISM="Rhodomonas abbreviata, Strain Caron Lab Isolate" /LENGTH=227 /DNA_ID=CAMNT_0023434561 /DNA_START=97 /DNA_END=777 /DNA_ORIENTATION=-